MPPRLLFRTSFLPVGQGLFVEGNLSSLHGGASFNFVYDCGSVSPRKHLDREVRRYLAWIGGGTLDVLHISHFDADHINGLLDLLRKLPTRTIVLPYLPLVERMLLALHQNAKGIYFDFLVDPAAVLIAIRPDARIIFVEGGDDRPEEGPEFPNDFNPDNLEPHFPLGTPFDPADSGGMPYGRQASVINHRHPVRVGAVFEFVYYNEHRPKKNLARLRHRVQVLLNRYHRPDGTYDFERLRPMLKNIYGSMLGKTGHGRNSISLVVYAGEVATWNRSSWGMGGRTYAPSSPFAAHVISHPSSIWPDLYFSLYSISILLTGDVFLNTPLKILALERHLGHRWQSLTVLQVPHHGSRHSWFTGAAAYFPARLAIVPAGRKRRCHPTPEVMADLRSTLQDVCHVHEDEGVVLWGAFP